MIRLLLPLLFAALSLSQPALAAETLIENINGYTLDSSGKLVRFQAMLIADGRVVATGSGAELTARASKVITVVDGGNRTLLPGLIDAHGHVMGLGANILQANLVGTPTLEAALNAVKSYAKANPENKWVLGRGWNQVIWNLGRFPTAKELDSVISDRPALLERVDGHATWANSAAMKLAGIDKNTKDPVGGHIERDADGNATGVFIDNASNLLYSKVPQPTKQERSEALDGALEEMASVGLTGVGDAGIDLDTYTLFKRYADEGKLTARLYAMIGGTDADFDAISTDGPLIAYGNDFLTVRSVKLYADGALGSRGAALHAPYADQPGNSGLLFHTPEALTAMITKAVAKGYQVNVHAIGDKANTEVLDGFAAVYRQKGGQNLRHRIEHAQVLTLADIPRFVPLNLIASMQPTHATSDMNMAEDRVGAERLRGAYAWRSFLKQGTRLAGGSDFPVESANPFFGLHAAVTRQDHDGKPLGGWHPEQALNITEALRAFTLDAAYAAHAEKTQGTLEPGKWADFILIDRDIFTVAPERIWSTQVLETWVGGKRVYQRKPAE
jgi:predicted amidohydrolase YtcJ